MTDPGTHEGRAFKALMIVLVLGMTFAAFRAVTWSDQSRARNFIVVAPEQTTMSIVDGPKPVSNTQGIHTWSVLPGPLTLSVQFPDRSEHQTKVIIPKGLGGLMLEVKQGQDGDLVLGYF